MVPPGAHAPFRPLPRHWFSVNQWQSGGARLSPRKMSLKFLTPNMKQTGQKSECELYEICKLWSFLKSTSVNNVCKLFQHLHGTSSHGSPTGASSVDPCTGTSVPLSKPLGYSSINENTNTVNTRGVCVCWKKLAGCRLEQLIDVTGNRFPPSANRSTWCALWAPPTCGHVTAWAELRIYRF